MKILLLEDDMALNRAIKKVLELEKSNNVETFFDGEEALNALDTQYDLYIMDINVPNVNGLELLRLIHNQNTQAKVIIISANTDLNTLKKAYALGCVDYLKKPFHLEELRIKINNLKIPKHFTSTIQLKNDDDTLTKKEKDLLNLLLENQDTVVTYELIADYVYKNNAMSMDALRTLVRRLRSKLPENIIKNILDEGYSVSGNSLFLNENLEQSFKERIQKLERENSELKKQKKALLKISITDSLTGLYNRVKILETFVHEQQQSIRHAYPISLILMDIDLFKNVNDLYGHNAGDVFLQKIANVLRTIFRKTDVIGRWGGEEFLILLPKTDLHSAKQIAMKLRKRIEITDFAYLGQRTVSCGVVTLHYNESLLEIIERADAALYLAKEYGRNRVEVASE